MASLTEVYEGGNGGADLRRLYAGVSLFAIGAILVVAGIVMASTETGSYFGLGLYEAREVAGIVGGVGLPAVLLGTMAALPKASRRVRVAGVVGGLVCVASVVMFRHWYPVDWVGASGNTTMTFVVTGTYFVGAMVTIWSLFVAVANFKARNDPGGTVTLEITKGGETRIVEVSNDNLRGKLGGIGLLGGTPDGNVETQTNRSASNVDTAASNRSQTTRRGESQGVTDGGATTDDAEFLTDDSPAVGDSYCGNCAHFRYVRTDDGMEPYCGLYSERMDDMDACEEWTPNT